MPLKKKIIVAVSVWLTAVAVWLFLQPHMWMAILITLPIGTLMGSIIVYSGLLAIYPMCVEWTCRRTKQKKPRLVEYGLAAVIAVPVFIFFLPWILSSSRQSVASIAIVWLILIVVLLLAWLFPSHPRHFR
jgi:hypothetical protein